MRIGEAAAAIGVPEHVLRHWDAEGVVVADRLSSGHRDYTEEHLQRLRVLRACQGIGMSLPQIRQVLHRHEAGREEMLREQLLRLRRQRADLERAEAFLAHVVGCEHDLLTRCPRCSAYG
ncbi:helix-turn-helix domain-containing protein [Demequina zhanjiangensis]|uniref:Helix-turn-helix domain-containing protein n=1 Tax=Demequina zhanjiangensis TaxID=3051659 RepID=A0ABT8G3Z0_9MICO|nr:helix-turn-helix domain-containing protein [Demequina sp. SYSU T00b26]MDN4473737.1 helix-turn-helix domain-containing protein [Demequina sp. SYSU T00b26]